MISDQDILKFKASWKKILESKRVLLVSHLSPDVDAIASLGALIEVLKDLNKDFVAFADGKNDDYYFIPNEEYIIGSKDDLFRAVKEKYNDGKDFDSGILNFFDLIISVDCGSVERTSLSDEIEEINDFMLDTFIIEFDHHPLVTSYADIEIKVPLASTTEVLYHFVDINNLDINRSLANCLLAGILTDTANFLYPSVSSSTLKIASEMMTLGAQFPKLTNKTWRNKSVSEMKLWGLALNNLQVNKKYNVAFSVLLHEDLNEFKKKFGGWGSDIFSDIVGFLSSLSEADAVFLLREEEVGNIKGSIRAGSNSAVDVSRFASFFGGGGHKKAAGFFIKGSVCYDKEKEIFKIY
jgi:bifunctional oligoribonuclease and PAP phosphatase NrnA